MAESDVSRRKALKGIAVGSAALAAASAAGAAHADPTTTTPSTTTPSTSTPSTSTPSTSTPSDSPTTTPSDSATPSTSASTTPTIGAPQPSSAAAQSPAATAAPGQKRVAILGGGVAGMTAAHELAERGYQVTIYERRAWGGKARSIETPLPTAGGRRPLPGEHGFRFFPGYYNCVPDTMKRIPVQGNKNGVYSNLVSAPVATAAENGQDLTLPFGLNGEQIGTAANIEWLAKTLMGGLTWIPKLPYTDLITFVKRALVYFASCDDRRYGQWEKQSFMEFAKIGAKSNPNYQLLISTLTRTLVAAKENKASARTIMNQGEAFILNFLNRANDGRNPDNVLNSPTNEAWINPWVDHLKSMHVDFQMGTEIKSLNVKDGKIASVTTKDGKDIDADWYVLAVSPELATGLLNNDILALDPDLDKIKNIVVDWMTGIQFFMNTNRTIAAGHIGWINSPWRLTGIQQGQFWKGRDISRDYGDGKVKDILSVDISDWDTPGVLIRKTAKQCSPEEIAKETWYQVCQTADNVSSNSLVSWFLDPGISWDGSKNTNSDPLMINTANSWDSRPYAVTKVPNLFLAGDYLRSNVDLATMEGACEGGRNAANGILQASGSTATKAQLWPHPTIKEFDQLRAQDVARYKSGKPNVLES